MIFRASSSARWLNCPGSVALSEGVENESSEWAAEGTAAHTLLEICQRFDVNPHDHVGDQLGGFTVTVEMADAVKMFLDWTKENVSAGADVYYERKLSGVGFDIPELSGHVDYEAVESDQVTILDFKYGAGVPVAAEGNTQLLSYAVLAHATRFKKIRLGIIQPRTDNPIRIWEIESAPVVEHLANIVRAIKESQLPNAELSPGDHCRWCPVQARCPKLHEQAMIAAQNEFELVKNSLLDEQDLAFWLDRKKQFESFLDAVSNAAKKVLEQGGEVPGYKLVETIANRRYIGDDPTIEGELRKAGYKKKDLYEVSMIGPAKVEKLPLPAATSKKQRDELMVALTHRPVTGSTIVPESDKRPAISTASPADDFLSLGKVT